MTTNLRELRQVKAIGAAPGSREITSLSSICCGRRLAQIDIRSCGTSMSFTYCGGCSAMRWFKDGLPTDDATLNAALRAVPRGTGSNVATASRAR